MPVWQIEQQQETHMAKRQRWTTGAIVEIPLSDGRFAFAQLSSCPVVAVFQGVYSFQPEINVILRQPLLFKCSVYASAVTKEVWQKVGKSELREDVAREDYYFLQDKVTGRLAVYHSEFAAQGWQRDANLSECQNLECAAVWEASHVSDRILAEARGEECKWKQLIAIDISRVPPDQKDV